MPSIDFICAQKKMRNIQKGAPMAEGNPKSPRSSNKQLSDSDTSKEEQINPTHKISKEERHYGTIHGSALATQIALSHSGAQATPMVKRTSITTLTSNCNN